MAPLRSLLRQTPAGCLLFGAAAVVGGLNFAAVIVSGTSVLDVRFGYSADEGAAVLTALGEAGRQHHKYFILADVVFLVLYGAALANLTFVAFGRRRPAAVLALVPVITAGADLVEDVGVCVALRAFPEPSAGALAAAGVAGIPKLVGFWLSLALLLVGLVLRPPVSRDGG